MNTLLGFLPQKIRRVFTFNLNTRTVLHDELIVEILTFLDVKSLMQMKCVCKSWKTLISDPVFVKMHFKKQSTGMTHLAFLSNKFEGSGDCMAAPISRLMECSSSSITLTDPYHQFNYKDAGDVLGSCNGLVCMQDCSFTAEYQEHSFSFWNPATRTKSEALLSFRNYAKEKNNCKFAFGYDNSTDTYKMVLLCLKRDGELIATTVKVFTLGDNVWRDIDCFPVELVYHRSLMFARDKVYLNNSINWVVRHRYYCHLKNLTVEKFVIISLDMRTETYTQLLLPRCCDEELTGAATLSVLMDCLCLSYDFNKTHFVIWQMKEFGVEESWTQLIKISFPILLKDFKSQEFNNDSLFLCPRLMPLCFSKDGDTLIFAINLLDQAILYNLKNNRATRIKSTNKIWWSAAKGYVESLVSTS
ncbi:putative F-box domain-containing protein [Medicago truncatula]|nr:putative F-box domain-containing protein [Medicago truncatula]